MTETETYRENMAEARRAHDRLDAFSLSINDSMIKSADAMIRNCLLISGGAAVAILAFMGAVISKDPGSHKIIGDIAGSLTYFAWGVVTSIVALGLAYIVHFLTYKHAPSQKKVWVHPYIVPGKHTAWWAGLKIGLHALAVAVAVVSAALFVMGLFAVKHAVTAFPSYYSDVILPLAGEGGGSSL
jgi:hypothetical protein